MDFARTFLAVFFVGIGGVLTAAFAVEGGENAIDVGAGAAALTGLLVASVSAGLRAIQAHFTTIETDPRLLEKDVG